MEFKAPLFLVGFSIGANVITKYLGEEGMAGTLPSQILGAISLGNPLIINTNTVKAPWKYLFALKSRSQIIRHFKQLRQMKTQHFRQTMNNILFKSFTLGSITSNFVPYLIRNSNLYPFETKIGYKTRDSYFSDTSSCNYSEHISIPLMILVSSDDNIAYQNTVKSLSKILSNPNIILVETKKGGHLGWHHAPHNNPFGNLNFFSQGGSWGDLATSKFIKAILSQKNRSTMSLHSDFKEQKLNYLDENRRKSVIEAEEQIKMIRSKL
mmetsp:Transcript_2249/g.3152  ORF Transcript_2249/g.3152 Transcript_2249/m.3152 type:complete len:267 (-) Transcript_2249:68-868(-)